MVNLIDEPNVNRVSVTALDGTELEQITTEDWRVYRRISDGKIFRSITHMISATWAKDAFLMNYIQSRGEDGKAAMEFAGEQGTRVHEAIYSLECGATIALEPYDKKERNCLMAFHSWWQATRPVFKWGETVVYSESLGYAATIDLFCEIGGENWVIDHKTSKACYDTHKIQVAAQQMALKEMQGTESKGGVLVLGNQTAKGWTLTALTDSDNRELEEIVKHLARIYELRFPEPKQVKQYPKTLSLKEESV